jgi:hypothetical protein
MRRYPINTHFSIYREPWRRKSGDILLPQSVILEGVIRYYQRERSRRVVRVRDVDEKGTITHRNVHMIGGIELPRRS